MWSSKNNVDRGEEEKTEDRWEAARLSTRRLDSWREVSESDAAVHGSDAAVHGSDAHDHDASGPPPQRRVAASPDGSCCIGELRRTPLLGCGVRLAENSKGTKDSKGTRGDKRTRFSGLRPAPTPRCRRSATGTGRRARRTAR